MLTFILALPLNVLLYLGMIREVDGALNIAVFIMWAMAIMSAFSMFISEDDLRKSAKCFVFVWAVRLITFATVFHSIWWGYYWAPSIWFIAVVVVLARRYEIDNRKRYK